MNENTPKGFHSHSPGLPGLPGYPGLDEIRECQPWKGCTLWQTHRWTPSGFGRNLAREPRVARQKSGNPGLNC